ncbi:ABC transporter permease [Paralimibaculum aggregatum]|uniref:ABC transporter permease n=1 Tax=Paralimibaculum aggregatum TaxID=3036245 RepID=A0ABQ6LQR8_9RHOB|nr:ABC transporter permease [Limibaculum sp. NKW23]GMG84427.1 ABC transporter permease [Limibaculum sp. NKW23]
MSWLSRTALPVLAVLAAVVALWYAGAVLLNAPWERDQAARAGTEIGLAELVANTMHQDRPVLPAPHQVAAEIWETTAEKRITSKRSLVYHASITLSATLVGFALGVGLGMLLAIGIVHNRAMGLSVMPWVIASQTVPILAVAPMIIVVLYNLGVQGLLAKAAISAYLSFFPVVVAMAKGLRAPDRMALDLMATWNASPAQVFWKLRLPAALPYLFPALKVAISIALVGAIIGELPTGSQGGFGARMLNGSYYGQVLIIWSALIGAACCAAVLVGLIGLIERLVLKAMGGRAWAG